VCIAGFGFSDFRFNIFHVNMFTINDLYENIDIPYRGIGGMFFFGAVLDNYLRWVVAH